MTIRELKKLVRAARDARQATANELSGADNPQVKTIRERADAQASVLDMVLAAMDGDAVMLKIMGEC